MSSVDAFSLPHAANNAVPTSSDAMSVFFTSSPPFHCDYSIPKKYELYMNNYRQFHKKRRNRAHAQCLLFLTEFVFILTSTYLMCVVMIVMMLFI